MIESFADPEAEKIFKGIGSRKLPLAIQKMVWRKLVYLDDADDLYHLFVHPVTGLNRFIEAVQVNIASVSMNNTESASRGRRAKRKT